MTERLSLQASNLVEEFTVLSKDFLLNILKSFLKNTYTIMYLFMVVLGLCCCTQAFSSCGKWGLLFVAVHISHCDGPSCCGAGALGRRASAVCSTRVQ